MTNKHASSLKLMWKMAELPPRTMNEFRKIVEELFPRYRPRIHKKSWAETALVESNPKNKILIHLLVWGDSQKWPRVEIEIDEEDALDPLMSPGDIMAQKFDRFVAQLMWQHYPRIQYGDNPPPSPYA